MTDSRHIPLQIADDGSVRPESWEKREVPFTTELERLREENARLVKTCPDLVAAGIKVGQIGIKAKLAIAVEALENVRGLALWHGGVDVAGVSERALAKIRGEK